MLNINGVYNVQAIRENTAFCTLNNIHGGNGEIKLKRVYRTKEGGYLLFNGEKYLFCRIELADLAREELKIKLI